MQLMRVLNSGQLAKEQSKATGAESSDEDDSDAASQESEGRVNKKREEVANMELQARCIT